MILIAPFLLIFTAKIQAYLGFLDRQGSPGYIEAMTASTPQTILSFYKAQFGCWMNRTPVLQ